MFTIILSDFSRVLLFPKDNKYCGSLNALNKTLIEKFGENYAFFDYFKLNNDLIIFYKDLTSKYPIYIFTSDSIQKRSEVKSKTEYIFSGVFSAKEFNISKKDSSSYSLIARKLNVSPEKILYIDDQLENIQAAKAAGLYTMQYTTFEDLKDRMTMFRNK